jgi:DNA-binding response OmpR family regulator
VSTQDFQETKGDSKQLARPLDGLSVLVVEDDYFLAEDARHALESAGARVLGPCGTLEDAQELIRSSQLDCALLDINLGHGPDFTAARTLIDRGVPVIFVTGYDCEIIPAELAHVDCIHKPTSPYKIVQAACRLCGR